MSYKDPTLCPRASFLKETRATPLRRFECESEVPLTPVLEELFMAFKEGTTLRSVFSSMKSKMGRLQGIGQQGGRKCLTMPD